MFTLWYLVLGYKEYKYARNGARSDKGLDTLSKTPRKDSLKDESSGVKKPERTQPITSHFEPKSVPFEHPENVTSQTPAAPAKAKAPEPPKNTPQVPSAEAKPQTPPEPSRVAIPVPPPQPQAKIPEPPRFGKKPETQEPLKLVIPDLPPAPNKPQAGVLSIPKNAGTPKTPESPSSKFQTGKSKPEVQKTPESKGSIPKEDEMLGRQGNRGPGPVGGSPKLGAEPSPRELSYTLHEVSGPIARDSSEEKANISNPDSLEASEDELEE